VAALALALRALYFALTLVLRDALHRRRTGRSGRALLAAPAGSLQWSAELLEVVAIALGVAAAIFAPTVEPAEALEVTGLQIAGVALYALGTATVFASQRAMGDSWRIGQNEEERTKLVTAGPFALVRNPIFSGLVLVQVGLSLLVPSMIALAGMVLLIISIELQVRRIEEPHLRRTHQGEYAGYASRVGRFFPGLGRLRD
jgi:protein-S-isoprenylcysteine O-methyltransferase Ste14